MGTLHCMVQARGVDASCCGAGVEDGGSSAAGWGSFVFVPARGPWVRFWTEGPTPRKQDAVGSCHMALPQLQPMVGVMRLVNVDARSL
jgi:hypothetical protein